MQIDIDRRLPFLERQIIDAARFVKTSRIVEKDIQPAKPFCRLRKCLINCVGIRHITGNGHGVWVTGNKRIEWRLTPRKGRDIPSGLNEAPGCRPTDTS